MLLEFNIENFLSFKNFSTLSMIGAKSFKEYEPTNIIKVDKHIKLLKSIVLYGNNASGKSNLISSIAFMKNIIINSFRDALIENNFDNSFSNNKFLLDTESGKQPSHFEMVFIIETIKYRYGFELDEGKIVSEWLLHTTSKEVPLFTREATKINVNKSSFKEGLHLEEKTKDNVLFLTLVAQLNGLKANKIITWFKNLNIINGLQDNGYKKYTINKLKTDKEFQLWVNQFTKFLEISKVIAKETAFSQIEWDKINAVKDTRIKNFIDDVLKRKGEIPKKNAIITWHKKYDKNNILIDTIPFDFETQESEGTKKLIYLLGPWYDTLKNGKILIVDELGSRLHTNLIRHLVEYFHHTNQTNAQLIFVAHDTKILSKDIFRRDQIWFIEKNKFGASELYSLGDFKSEKVRKNSAYDKNYIRGKYGAIPYFENKERLINLMYGKEKI